MDSEDFVILITGIICAVGLVVSVFIFVIWRCYCCKRPGNGQQNLARTSTQYHRGENVYETDAFSQVPRREIEERFGTRHFTGRLPRPYSHVFSRPVYTIENERRIGNTSHGSPLVPDAGSINISPHVRPTVNPLQQNQRERDNRFKPEVDPTPEKENTRSRRVRRNSEPVVPTYTKEQVSRRIRQMQGRLRKNEDTDNGKLIEEAQNMLLELRVPDQALKSEDCRLVIGVDATPAAQAGYCVNLKENSIRYYVIHKNNLPFKLCDPKDPSEFEMKNFIFALTLWADEIVRWKRIRIYTDNFAITKTKDYDKNHHGDGALKVLNHFEDCKGVVVLNKQNMAVNKFKNLELFAKYLRPADDLSRFHIDEAVHFLTTIYGVDKENVDGTQRKDVKRLVKDGTVWFEPNERYREILHLVNTNILKSCYNANCSQSKILQALLKTKK